ncbi:hypothetical protein D3C71_732790 [compost metagenome]
MYVLGLTASQGSYSVQTGRHSAKGTVSNATVFGEVQGTADCMEQRIFVDHTFSHVADRILHRVRHCPHTTHTVYYRVTVVRQYLGSVVPRHFVGQAGLLRHQVSEDQTSVGVVVATSLRGNLQYREDVFWADGHCYAFLTGVEAWVVLTEQQVTGIDHAGAEAAHAVGYVLYRNGLVEVQLHVRIEHYVQAVYPMVAWVVGVASHVRDQVSSHGPTVYFHHETQALFTEAVCNLDLVGKVCGRFEDLPTDP